jgi:hypothetical protein
MLAVALALALCGMPAAAGAAPPGWTEPVALGVEYAGEDLRVAVDASGKDHVAFHRQAPNGRSGVWYATNQSGAWSNRQITEDYDPLRTVYDRVRDIDVSPTGNVFLLIRRSERWNSDATPDNWYDGPGAGWYLATNRSGSWVVESLPVARAHTEVKFHVRSGKYHLAIVTGPPGDIGSGEILHKTNASGSWVTRNVPLPAAGWASHIDFGIDGDGNMAIAYVFGASASADGVYVALRRDGAWSRRKLHTTDPPVYPDFPELAIDSGNGVHVIWQVFVWSIPEKHHLWYATSRAEWTRTRIVESRSYDGVLAADSNGKAHIVYHDDAGANENRVGYATNAAGGWAHQELTRAVLQGDSLGLLGVGVDPQNRPHVFIERAFEDVDIWRMRKQ